MNKLAVLFVSFSLQCGHGIKFVDKSSTQLMQQTTQLAEQSWPSLSTIIDDVDFGLDSNVFEASEGEGVGVNAAEADKHAEQVMADTLLQMRSTNFKEALESQSEFQAMSDAQKHQYYKGSEGLHRLSKSLGLARFMTEGVPKLMTSMKQDAPFMAFLDDTAEKLPQPADKSVEAGAPLLKELSKTAPRVAKYLMPKVSELLKSDGHVALLQEEDLLENSTGSVHDTEDAGDEHGEPEEEEAYENIVPRTVAYLRFQTGFHVPIPFNPNCTGACVYLDLGLLLVKLAPFYNSRPAAGAEKFVFNKKGPCFIILRPGVIFRMTWGVMHARAYLPTVQMGVINIKKWGWEVGYTYSPGDLPLPAVNTLQKYGGWLLGVGPAWKYTMCSTDIKGNVDSFGFVEPMLGFKVSWLGKTTMWLPMVRTGHSAEDTGHQAFALLQPITVSVGTPMDYPKNIGITVGQLLNWKLPESRPGNQCKKEVPPEQVEDPTPSGASEDAPKDASA